MTVMYGITNCSTVKKARAWLEQRGVEYRFHDFRKNGLDQTLLKTFIKNLGWEALLNKSGMTWRTLPEKDKAKLEEKKAASLMLAHPTVIKRPVLAVGEKAIKYHVGFNEKDYETLFTKKK
ncbi:MAG TPA: ArsC family reductase [Gammaproteobacteria bacterium]|nr:ArsC family reductase [Gammaproteobacteria bacterium]